jgi:chromosome segregation ATPase
MEKEDSSKTSLTKKDISDTFNEFFGKVIEPRFDRIESYIEKQIGPRFDRIESYIQRQIEPRFDKIDKKLEENDKKFNDLLNHFDQIYNRLDRLETEYFTITAGLQRVEKQLVGIEEKLDKEIAIRERLEGEISDLKQRVVALQRKIEEIEIRLKTIS